MPDRKDSGGPRRPRSARRRSAGLLLYRRRQAAIEVLLVHPGGPFWAKRDLGAWSIPKGELEPDEEPRLAALREFAEETGTDLNPDPSSLLALGEIVQKAGKAVTAFAVEGDLDPAAIRSNLVEIVWPPRRGRRMHVPEIDRAGWFGLDEARGKINAAQAAFLDRLAALACHEGGGDG